MDAASANLVLARHGRTFALAARFLPADARDDAAIVYALCRAVDDLADEAGDVAGLAAVRAELQGEASPRALVGASIVSVGTCAVGRW